MNYSYTGNKIITTNGDLYCWGDNEYGQVGNGTTTKQRTPIKVLDNVTAVSLSSNGSIAITANKDLYYWGGDGKKTIPTKAFSNVTDIASGAFHNAAIMENGDLQCWGHNDTGQVGSGVEWATSAKVLGNVAAVSLGNWHSAAITTNGDLYCWGNNGSGQIGNGTIDNIQLTPVKINFESDSTGDDDEKPSENPTDSVDNLKIAIHVTDWDHCETNDGSKIGTEGARVEIEGIGEAVTDDKGMVYITNTLLEPSAMKRISITKDGYRDYIFYTPIVCSELVDLWNTNRFAFMLEEKKEGDDVNPYISTMVHYRSGRAKHCTGDFFERNETVTFRICGVWNGKEPGYYSLWRGDKHYESEDGVFRLNIGRDLAGSGRVYVKMVAADGTESESKLLYVTLPTDNTISFENDNYVSILNESSESNVQEKDKSVPFLNDDKLSFDLGKIKTTIKRNGKKIRIMLGADLGDGIDVFDDKAWEKWKKYCKEKPTYLMDDLSLTEWNNIAKKNNLETAWTEKAKISATGYGWLENDLSLDSTTPLTGGIRIVINAGTKFQQQYAIGPVPVYMEESLGVNGELNGEATFDTSTKKFGGSTELKITPSFSVGGGVGVLYAVTLGFEGSAFMPSVIKFPLKLMQSDLKGGLSIKASVLGFNYSKEMLNGTYPLYKAEDDKAQLDSVRENPALDGMDIYNGDCYVLPDKVESEAKWCGNQTIRLKNVSGIKSNLKEKLLIEGASELSEPIIVQEGDTTIAVFLTEDSSRDVVHRTKLVYMVYDSVIGEWSSPVAVDDDGTGDFYPYLAASNGRIAVSWMNYADSITNASGMEQALQSSGICYAVWNKDTGSFEKASGVLGSSPAASYNNARIYIDTEGNVTEVGLKNTACNIFGMSGDNILFMTGMCNGASVDREFTLSQGLPVSYDVSAPGGNVTAAVCIDMDKDLNTLDDREIYLYASDGSIERLTENNTYDAMPQYAGYQGNDALFWYAVDGIHVLEKSGQKHIISGGEDVQISENFTVINGEKGEAAIIWPEADDDQTYQLAGCLYDAQSGKWTRQVFLSDSNKDIFRPDGYFNADGDMEFLYRKGSTAGPGEICSLQVVKAPDLEVVNAYIEDGTEIPGENTKVYVGVRNLGTRTVTGCSIDIEGQETVKSVNILPGESALLETEYKVPDTIGRREITVQALVQDDSDISNNMFKMQAGYADLSVSAIEDDLGNGKEVHVAVGNYEPVPANAILEVHKNTVDGEVLSSIELGTLNQNDLVAVEFFYRGDSSGYDLDANGLYYVVKSSIEEKYESNNYDYVVLREKGVSDTDEKKKVERITLSLGDASLNTGNILQLKADVFPVDAMNKTLKWSSDNLNVATVDQNGMVTAVGIGQAIITAESTDGSGVKAS